MLVDKGRAAIAAGCFVVFICTAVRPEALDLNLPGDSILVVGINSDYQSDLKIHLWKGMHFRFIQSLGMSYHLWCASAGYAFRRRLLQGDICMGTEGSYRQGPLSYWFLFGTKASWRKMDFYFQYAFSLSAATNHSQPLIAASYRAAPGVEVIAEYSTRYQYLRNMEVLNGGVRLFSGRISAKAFGQLSIPIIYDRVVYCATIKLIVEYALL